MTGLWVLTRKEVLEQRRTWKFLAMVGVFTSLALLFSIITYVVTGFTDDPRDKELAHGLLEGFAGTTVFLGTLLTIIVAMGSLAGERSSGTAAMTLGKPVSRAAFVMAKFLGLVLSIFITLAISSTVMYILTLALIDSADLTGFATYMAIIGVYLVFIGSITFFWSGMFSRQLLAGGLAFLLIVVQGPLVLIPHTERYWPITTPGWGQTFFMAGGNSSSDQWPAFAVTLGCIALLSTGAWAVFRRKEL